MDGDDSSGVNSGTYDKNKVLDVKPLRCLAPLFPSHPVNSSASTPSPSPSPFVSAPPYGPFPTGYTPFYPFHNVSNAQTSFQQQNVETPSEKVRGFRRNVRETPPPQTQTQTSANADAAGDGGPASKKLKSQVKFGKVELEEMGSGGVSGSGIGSGGRRESFTSPFVGNQISAVGEGSSNRVKKPKSRSIKRVKKGDDISINDGNSESVWEIRMKYDALRRRISQLEDAKETSSGNKRADLRANSILTSKGIRMNAKKRTGMVPGIEVGDIFFFRIEMCLVGLHAPSMAGIDYMMVNFDQEEETVAVSIVSSVGYEDDVEDKDVLVYSGQGGVSNKKDVKEAVDQKLERGNLALERSLRRGNEVRVIRGMKDLGNPTGKVYIYDGLYKIHESWTEKGKSGCNVFKYKLLRIPGQPEAFAIWKSVQQWRDNVNTRPGLILPDLTSGAEKLPVALVNDIDDEKGPAHFTYSTILKYVKPFSSLKPPVKCSCRGQCLPGDPNCPCVKKNGGQLPHTNGLLVIQKDMIYECGPSCGCYPNCRNHVSQTGLKVRLEVFKSIDRGWGLRSWDPIRAGTFVCEYAGEVIDKKKVEDDRDEFEDDDYVFDSTCDIDHTYEWNYMPELLDEVPNGDSTGARKPPLSLLISAKNTGNVARFMNHSCSPNVFWQPVLYDHNDELFPHIMFYAMKQIPPMTELTYDYGIGSHFTNVHRRKKCLCGSLKCKGYFH